MGLLVNLLSELNLPLEDINKLREIKRNEVNNTIAFTNTIYKTRYNISYIRLAKLSKDIKVYLRLYYRYTIPSLTNRKLS